MKKIVLFVLLFSLAVVGLHYANAYTSAMVENPVSLNITNPHGMLSLIPKKNLEIMQDNSAKALTLTNNMGVFIAYKLKCSHAGISIDENDESGLLAPGKSNDIVLEVSGDCNPGLISLEITLFAEFDGGRAEVKTTLPLTVIEAPRPDQATLEDDGEDEKVEEEGDPEEEVDSGDETPAEPGAQPPTGGEESLIDIKDGEENNIPPGAEGSGNGLTDDQ